MNKILLLIIINYLKAGVRIEELQFELGKEYYYLKDNQEFITADLSAKLQPDVQLPVLNLIRCQYKALFYTKINDNDYIIYYALIDKLENNKYYVSGEFLRACNYSDIIFFVKLLKKNVTNNDHITKNNITDINNTTNITNSTNNNSVNESFDKLNLTKLYLNNTNFNIAPERLHSKNNTNLKVYYSFDLLPKNGGYIIDISNYINKTELKYYNKFEEFLGINSKTDDKIFDNVTAFNTNSSNLTEFAVIDYVKLKKEILKLNLYYPEFNNINLNIPIDGITSLRELTYNSVIRNIFPNKLNDDLYHYYENILLFLFKLDYQTTDGRTVYLPVYFRNYQFNYSVVNITESEPTMTKNNITTTNDTDIFEGKILKDIDMFDVYNRRKSNFKLDLNFAETNITEVKENITFRKLSTNNMNSSLVVEDIQVKKIPEYARDVINDEKYLKVPLININKAFLSPKEFIQMLQEKDIKSHVDLEYFEI